MRVEFYFERNIVLQFDSHHGVSIPRHGDVALASGTLYTVARVVFDYDNRKIRITLGA